MTGCLPRNAVTSSSPAVWITDAVLAESLRRFTCTHRRHGSNVPGPLEARRRGAKRRNTNLAYNGASPVDPAILFPKESRDAWWQQESRPRNYDTLKDVAGREGSLASRALPFILPPWRLPQPEPPRTIENDHPALDLLEAKHLRMTTAREPRTSLNQGLKLCQNVEDVKNLLNRHSIQLQQVPDVSIAIFGYVLGSRWTAEDVAAFISEPDLNPTGTTNHVRLVRRVTDPLRDSPYRTVAHWETLRLGIGRAARLGLVDPESVREIIEAIPKVRAHSQGTGRLRPAGETIRDTSALLESFTQSSIYQLKDLGDAFIQNLSENVAQTGPSTSAMELLLRLREVQATEPVTAFAHVIERWLSRPDQRQSIFLLRDAMLILPTQILLPVISRVTENVMLKRNTTTNALGSRQWQQVLHTLYNGKRSGHHGENFSDPKLLQIGLTDHLTAQQQFLVLAWVIHSLHYLRGFSRSQVNSFRLDKAFREAFRQTPDQLTNDVLATVVSTLQTINVPDQALFLRHLSLLTKYNLVLYSGIRSPKEDVDGLLQRELHQLADDTFYTNAKMNFNDALVEACHSTNASIASFANTAYDIIKNDRMDFKVLTRALKHNRDLHFALSQSRRPPDAARAASIQHITPPDTLNESSLTPRTALSIINTIALAFAKSDAITPRSALQKVYWCYIFLHRYGAPIEAPISRALWHAGVIRYGSDRVSKTQLLWIMRIVRKVEGKETARALLFNVGFRKHRADVMERVAVENGIDGPEYGVKSQVSAVASMFRRKDNKKFIDLG